MFYVLNTTSGIIPANYIPNGWYLSYVQDYFDSNPPFKGVKRKLFSYIRIVNGQKADEVNYSYYTYTKGNESPAISFLDFIIGEYNESYTPPISAMASVADINGDSSVFTNKLIIGEF